MIFEKTESDQATVLQIRITKGQKQKLKTIANKLDMTVTDLIKTSVDEYIKRVDYLL